MPRPHIVILMTDQQRGDSMGCAGHPHLRTPKMDRIAAEGVRFPQACTSSPVCMPARSSFLSGLPCHSHGQWGNVGQLPEGTDTFALRLREAGYHTCHVGKSHYYRHTAGDHMKHHLPYLDALGWTDVFETTGPFATQKCGSILTDRWEPKGLWKVFNDDYEERARVGRARSTWPSPLPLEDHPDEFVGQTAVEYIAGYDRDVPLCLFVGFGGPHYPWDAPKEWAEKYDPAEMDPALPIEQPQDWSPPETVAHLRDGKSVHEITPEENRRCRALYYAKISHIDHWFGQIMDALGERGMLEETAILFWSDHGEMLCDKGRFAKSEFYESSLKVPFMLRPPGGLGEGTVSPALVSTIDAFPTLLGLGGCDIPESTPGRSLLPLVTDPEAPHHQAVFSEVDCRTMVYNGKWKLVVRNDGRPLQLYNVQEDPRESTNLAGSPGTASIVAELRDRMLDWHLVTQTRQPAYPPTRAS